MTRTSFRTIRGPFPTSPQDPHQGIPMQGGIVVEFGRADAIATGLAAARGGVAGLATGGASGRDLIALSADGGAIAALRLWSGGPVTTDTLRALPVSPGPGEPALVVLPTGVVICAPGADHLLRLPPAPWGTATPEVLGLGGLRVAGPATALPDGRLAVAVSGGGAAIIDPSAAGGAVHAILPLLADTTVAEWQDPGLARGITALDAVALAGGGVRLVAAVGGAERVIAYDIGPSGAIASPRQIGAAEGVALGDAAALATVTRGDATLAIVAGQGSDTLAVLEFGADGHERVRDQVMDTRDLRLGQVSVVRAIDAMGTTFVLAGGAEAGLSLFAHGPDARLYHLATTVAVPGAEFGSLADLAVIADGGTLQVAAARQGAPEVIHLAVDLSELGSIGGTLQGETLRGTARDDIVIATHSARRLEGGTGADLFVFGPDVADAGGFLGSVADFEPEIDRLDLSGFALLYGRDGVSIAATADGARISLRDRWLDLRSADGQPLDPVAFSDRDLVEGLHLPWIPAVAPPVFEPRGPSGWQPSVPGPELPDPPHRDIALFAFSPESAPAWGARAYADWVGFVPQPLAPPEAAAIAAQFALLM
jgi:hypothetical protein